MRTPAVPRALLAAHVSSLLRLRIRESPQRGETVIVVAGPGGLYDIVDVRLLKPNSTVPGGILLEIVKR